MQPQFRHATGKGPYTATWEKPPGPRGAKRAPYRTQTPARRSTADTRLGLGEPAYFDRRVSRMAENLFDVVHTVRFPLSANIGTQAKGPQ